MNHILKILMAVIFASASVVRADGVTQAQLTAAQQQAMSMSASQVPPPAPPNYSQCTGRTDESSCRMQLESQYQQNLVIYNQAKAQAAAQQAAQQQQYVSAKQAALDAQKQNEAGQKQYNVSQILTQVASMAAMAKFTVSCIPPSTCQYPWLALSMAMAIFSNMAGQQAKTHDQSKYQSCTLANQISTTQANCGNPPGQFNFAGYPDNTGVDPATIVDSSGNCIASADICSQINSGLPPGVSLKDYQKGLSAFASGQSPYKVNPDGSITNLKNGKTYTADNFKDAASMTAAGMSPADANFAANMMKGLGSGNLDPKKDLSIANADSGFGGAGFGDDAAAKAAAAAAAAGNGNLDKDAAADAAKKARAIASAEGLSKDFNGELIGVSGDDIFKMMNRRYRLKTDQDSFLGIRP
jgi:hypothetical protein